MSTGTVQTPKPTLQSYREIHPLALSLLNGSGSEIVDGTEVIITGDNSVSPRTVGTTYPIGIVTVQGESGDYLTVTTVFSADLEVVATGGALTAGSFVKPNGVFSSDGIPQYVAASPGDISMAIVLAGAADTEVARVGILRTPSITM